MLGHRRFMAESRSRETRDPESTLGIGETSAQ